MKRGYAVSGMLYTLLILFMVLLISFLYNMQNKKTVLDNLKAEVVDAFYCKEVDAIQDFRGNTVIASTITSDGTNALIQVPKDGRYDTTSNISVPIETIRNEILVTNQTQVISTTYELSTNARGGKLTTTNSVNNVSYSYDCGSSSNSGNKGRIVMTTPNYYDLTDLNYLILHYNHGANANESDAGIYIVNESGTQTKISAIGNLTGVDKAYFVNISSYSGKYKIRIIFDTGTNTYGYPNTEYSFTIRNLIIC